MKTEDKAFVFFVAYGLVVGLFSVMLFGAGVGAIGILAGSLLVGALLGIVAKDAISHGMDPLLTVVVGAIFTLGGLIILDLWARIRGD